MITHKHLQKINTKTATPCEWTRVERVERVVFLLGFIVVLLDVFVWRP